jgi:dCTP deaminase
MLSGNKLKEVAQLTFKPYQSRLVGATSVDVTLGVDIFRPKSDCTPIDLTNIPDHSSLFTKISLSDHTVYALPPRSFIKAVTAEYIKMPEAFTGMFSLRSAVAQIGLEQSTSVWIRPGWEGHLVLELSNLTARPLLLSPGLIIGQIHFFEVH